VNCWCDKTVVRVLLFGKVVNYADAYFHIIHVLHLVYDAKSYAACGTLLVSVTLFVDMVACSFCHCLYIVDAADCCRYVIRLGLPSNLSKWTLVGISRETTVSVTSSHLLLVAFPEAKALKLFRTDGMLQSVVRLQREIVSLTSAAELTPGKYVLTRGSGEDTLHRVCVVDDEGKILRTYGGLKGSYPTLLNNPQNVVVDKNVFVYIDDAKNERLVILSPNLERIHCITGVFRKPNWSSFFTFHRKMQMDKESGHMFFTLTGSGEKRQYYSRTDICTV